MATLVTGVLDRATAGRKAKPLDQELIDSLVEYFKSGISENGLPKVAGPSEEYETKGRANSAGRKYADAVGEALGHDFRVSIYVNEGTDPEKGPFLWRMYAPMYVIRGEKKPEKKSNK